MEKFITFFYIRSLVLNESTLKGGKLTSITSARKAQKTINALIHLKNQFFLKAAELVLKCPKFFLVISDKWPKFLNEKKPRAEIVVFCRILVKVFYIFAQNKKLHTLDSQLWSKIDWTFLSPPKSSANFLLKYIFGQIRSCWKLEME